MSPLRSILLLMLPLLLAAHAAGQPHWSTGVEQWTPADEQGFSAFVEALGASDCRTVDACLRSTENRFRHTDPPGMRLTADCADFPYVLRAYYAWKHGLPFSYASSVTHADPSDPGRDLRYSWRGNRVATRRHVGARPEDGPRALRALTASISTATFRLDPRHEHPERFHDLYPVAITRDSVRPGTVFYDPRGHVAVVYRVEDDGRILLLNAHPDNSITRTTYGPEYPRQEPELGGGFHNWRPQRLEGATRRADGVLIGGRIVAARNADLADYSLVQYVGTRPHPTDWRQGSFAVEGAEAADFHDYVRRALAAPGYRFDPAQEVRRAVQAICEDLHARVDAVELARTSGMADRRQPPRLPANIYGADGDWETYSTPGRDTRLRASFVALATLISRARAVPSGSLEAPNSVAAAVEQAYADAASACTVTYVSSVGQPVSLTFEDVRQRLFALSFDPYHCPELRWGASGSELATCPDGPEKRRWYAAQQRLRYVTDRDPQARMGWSLDELERLQPGPEEAPDVSVVSL